MTSQRTIYFLPCLILINFVTGFSSLSVGKNSRNVNVNHNKNIVRQSEGGSIFDENQQYSQLYSSMNDDFDDDDILSELIGKRSEIKKSIKPTPTTSSADDGDESSSSSSSSSSTKTPSSTTSNVNKDDNDDDDTIIDENWDMNSNDLPTFKTKRISSQKKYTIGTESQRRGRSSYDPRSDGSSSSAAADDASSSEFDFKVDYDDENDLHIPNRIGFTTISWGDANRGFVPGGKLNKKAKRSGKFVPGDAQMSYNNLLRVGVSFVETSENYGSASRGSTLSAEHILGRCMEENNDHLPIVASTFTSNKISKILSNGIRIGSGSVENALQKSCDRMEATSIELYQLEKSLLPNLGMAAGLASCIDSGLCSYVGLKGASKSMMKRYAKKLDSLYGIQLTSNNFEFSLTNRKAWKNGLIDTCKDLGVIPLVSNPLDKNGLASGKYTATNPSGGEIGISDRFDFKTLEKLQPLHQVQESIAEKCKQRVKREGNAMKDRYKRGAAPNVNTDITTTQVAINYVIAKGAVPLLDISDPKQADELIGCLGWDLTDEEVEMLDSAASLCGY